MTEVRLTEYINELLDEAGQPKRIKFLHNARSGSGGPETWTFMFRADGENYKIDLWHLVGSMPTCHRTVYLPQQLPLKSDEQTEFIAVVRGKIEEIQSEKS